jgi:hypothetical protein
MSFSASVDDRGFSDAIAAAIGLAPSDFAPELADLGKFLIDEIHGEFGGGRDPYGNKWIPLKPITVRVKRERGSQHADDILMDTLQLLKSFKAEVLPVGLSVYTDRRFPDGTTAEIHQFGGTHPRSLNFIPAREMLPFSRDLPVDWLSHVEVFLLTGATRIFK